MYVGTFDESGLQASRGSRHRDSRIELGVSIVGSSDSRRDYQRPQSLHRLSDWVSGLPTVGTSDLRRDFRHQKSSKNILRAREVLEGLSFDFIFILEHSIFLRPSKLASLFIVRRNLNSKQRIKLWRALWVCPPFQLQELRNTIPS